MMGFIQGKVLFSDGQECVLLTNSGVGYQIKTGEILPEGQVLGLYISHVIRDNSQELFGFSSMQEKKLFELLLGVKGVGPKGAYSIARSLGFLGVMEAIASGDKKSLQRAPGIGAKAAAQVVLDLEGKMQKVAMYSKHYCGRTLPPTTQEAERESDQALPPAPLPTTSGKKILLDDALLACAELGFRSEQVIPVAQKLLSQHDIAHCEQLVHLILKDM